MIRIGALLTGAVIAAGAALAVAGAATLTRVDVDHCLYPLLSDFDADGVHETLLVIREVRTSDAGDVRVRTRLALVEPLPAGTDHGLRIGGRRFRPLAGGQRLLRDLEPPPGFPGEHLERSSQTRYGMYSLVTLPMRDVHNGRVVPVSFYNHHRGRFRVAVGAIDLDAVADLHARGHMAAVIGSRDEAPSTDSLTAAIASNTATAAPAAPEAP